MLKWTKHKISLVTIDLDTIQAARKWIDDDVCFVELTGNGQWIVIMIVLTPNDMNEIITHMTFLENLLRIISNCWHLGDFVENNFLSVISPIHSP